MTVPRPTEMLDPDVLLDITIPGRPYPLKRSRRRGQQDYDPPENQAAKDKIRWLIGWRGDPYEGKVMVGIRCCYRQANPTADVDNLAKTVLDALNGYVIKDDRQVVRLLVTKGGGHSPADECTEISVRCLGPRLGDHP